MSTDRARGRSLRPQPWVAEPPIRLSPRELEALVLLSSGLTNKQAAHTMGVGHSSFVMFTAQARFRLDRSKTNERAVLIAAARGLIELPKTEVVLNVEEQQALAMFREGGTAREIAKSLDVSLDTVKMRVRVARRKLGVSSTQEAADLYFGASG